ncbi:hypothetical protein GGR53DRAFT_469668 [Hypoxylon sp. FL1150]|nr:hypothetical protein GGR53DRAFT_469668 [Hypoxylon sp. FL1150]
MRRREKFSCGFPALMNKKKKPAGQSGLLSNSDVSLDHLPADENGQQAPIEPQAESSNQFLSPAHQSSLPAPNDYEMSSRVSGTGVGNRTGTPPGWDSRPAPVGPRNDQREPMLRPLPRLATHHDLYMVPVLGSGSTTNSREPSLSYTRSIRSLGTRDAHPHQTTSQVRSPTHYGPVSPMSPATASHATSQVSPMSPGFPNSARSSSHSFNGPRSPGSSGGSYHSRPTSSSSSSGSLGGSSHHPPPRNGTSRPLKRVVIPGSWMTTRPSPLVRMRRRQRRPWRLREKRRKVASFLVSVRCSKNIYFENVYFENVYFENVYFENVYFENVYFENVYFENVYPENVKALDVPTKTARGTIEIMTDLKLVEAGSKVGPSKATLLNMLNISPFTYGLGVSQVYDQDRQGTFALRASVGLITVAHREFMVKVNSSNRRIKRYSTNGALIVLVWDDQRPEKGIFKGMSPMYYQERAFTNQLE